MAKKKKKLTTVQKFLIVGGVLIVFQVVFIVVFRKDQSRTVREAIEKAVMEQESLTPERREQLKIQLALADYMIAHENKPPEDLGQLVPKYFDMVPVNPTSNQPFKYQIVNGRPVVGEPGAGYSSSERKRPAKSGGSPTSAEEEDLLIASLVNPEETEDYVYDPSGKRDPFQPFDFSPKDRTSKGKTPLEKYTIGQLKLTAVLAGFDEPTAFVEDANGKGYPVVKGTKIGPNGGEVVDILADRILILETSTDFTGQSKTRTVEMKLREKKKKD